MRITPLGVGDAFDADQPNSSALVEQDGFTLLIDCGHSVVPVLWRTRPDPNAIDAVYFTHHHADHVLGLPPVLDRWGYEGRKNRLLIVASPDGQAQLQSICQLLGIIPQFPVHYTRPEDAPTLGPFSLRTAPTQHYVPNRALRLASGTSCLAYSGDGTPTEAARAIYADADLLLHECWGADDARGERYHSNLALVRSIVGPRRIGLYHIRAGLRAALEAAVAGEPRLFVVRPGEPLDL